MRRVTIKNKFLLLYFLFYRLWLGLFYGSKPLMLVCQCLNVCRLLDLIADMVLVFLWLYFTTTKFVVNCTKHVVAITACMCSSCKHSWPQPRLLQYREREREKEELCGMSVCGVRRREDGRLVGSLWRQVWRRDTSSCRHKTSSVHRRRRRAV